ncbi:MAG TPA: hypothetical protein VGG97_17930 [Bryobacteraceae bacterium]|jgi:hypothetical protein
MSDQNIPDYKPNNPFIIHGAEDEKTKAEREERERQKAHDNLVLQFQSRQTEAQETQANWSKRVGKFTIVLVVVTAIGMLVSYLQFVAARNSAKAAEAATYLSCLSAQTAQATLLEMRNDADYSYAMARVAATQNFAEMDSGRAVVRVVATTPTQENIMSDKFLVNIEVRNDGKGTAVNVTPRYKAVLVRNNDILRFDNKHMSSVTAAALREKESSTPVPTPGFKAAHLSIRVLDGTNAPVIPSPIIQDFFAASSATIYFYGNVTYSDIFRKYTVKFCQPLYIMQAGTTRTPMESEKNCGRYNEEKSEYLTKPLPDPLPSTLPKEIQQIVCTPPSKQ